MKVWLKSAASVGSEAANRDAAALGEGKITGWHAKAAHRDFPEIEHGGAEQQRDQDVDRAHPLLADRPKGGERDHAHRRGKPGRDDDGPEACGRVAGDVGIMEQKQRYGRGR